jgi:hypothetical protein
VRFLTTQSLRGLSRSLLLGALCLLWEVPARAQGELSSRSLSPEARLEDQWVSFGDGEVEVPLFVRNTQDTQGLQLLLWYPQEILEFSRYEANEEIISWSAIDPRVDVLEGGRSIRLERYGQEGEEVEEEQLIGWVVFSLLDPPDRGERFHLGARIDTVRGDDPGGRSVFFIRGREGADVPIPESKVTGSKVDVYYGSGVEVGKGGITESHEQFVLPVYVTYLEAREPAAGPPPLSVGIDYDELFLHLEAVEGVSPALAEGDLSPEADGRYTTIFSLPFVADFTGPLVRVHVADLYFRYMRPEGVLPYSVFEVTPYLVVGASEEDAPGGGAANDGDASPGGEPGVAGGVQILAPYFVRGNVDAVPAVGVGNVSDVIRVLEALFFAARDLDCAQAADTDANSRINITDAILLLDHLFQGGKPPEAPYPDPGFGEISRLGCRRPIPLFMRLESFLEVAEAPLPR